ncbi:MAG: HAD family hydrolase [Hyphomicrobiaceae bacterium]|nr:HAD family hydrolase [Hyphomicrobiaceae bacterium]
MIKAILFDFGQTLVDSADGFRTAEKEAQQKLHAALSRVPWGDFIERYRRIRKAFHDRSEFSRVAIWQAVFDALGQEGEGAALERWEEEYWATVNRRTVLFPEATEVLAKLAADYRLALVTNTQGQVKSEAHRLSEFPVLERSFETIVVAGARGIAPKPDPQPFRLCLARLDLSAAEAVFVGDDYRIDVCGAIDVGMRSIWLKHRSVARNWPSVSTTVPVIHGLDELLDLDRALAV